MNRRPGEELASWTQITLRLDRDLVSTIDELADDEGLDRTELARRLLPFPIRQGRSIDVERRAGTKHHGAAPKSSLRLRGWGSSTRQRLRR